ncbi:MAG: aldo/keto reductase [Phycisphaeraceae bacterium]|nr:aldo/keto reductase [Phycisphaeraceae bacterium]
MQYRTIAGTDLRVSLLGFGNFVFGANWWGQFTDDDAVRLQNQAFDLGVNFFDTAAVYGDGRAEQLLARTIQYAGRENLVISTKFGYDFYSDPDKGSQRERKQDFSPAFLRQDLEQSLRRLNIECVDLYQGHNLKLPQFHDDLFDTLEKFVRQGKIRHFGVALGPAIGWREEGYKAFLERGAAVVQTVFNLYEQDPGREFCQIAEHRGCGGVIARVPTNSGILDEEFSSDQHVFPSGDHRRFRDRNWLVYGLKKNAIVRPMAAKLGLSLPQFAFQWLASFPSLASIEPNLLNLEQVRQFAWASDAPPLPAEIIEELNDLYERDFDLGPDAHPCAWKSSVAPGGTIRSSFQDPTPVLSAHAQA